MAASPETYRRAQAALSSMAVADLRKVWPRLLTMRPDHVAEALALVLAEVTDKYGSASAALAAEWFEELRAGAGASGVFRAQAAALPSTERLEILSRWGIGPLFGDSPDPVAARNKVFGGLTRQVLGVGRGTLMESLAADPAGPRYARHASANACAFCALLATRGAVYWSEADARATTGANLGGTDYRKARKLDGGLTSERRSQTLEGRRGRDTTQAYGDKYHDDCRCTAVPVWPGERYEEAPYVKKWREAYANAPGKPGEALDVKETLASMRSDLGTN